MYVCVYVCMYLYPCVCVHIYIYIYVCVYIYIYVYAWLYVFKIFFADVLVYWGNYYSVRFVSTKFIYFKRPYSPIISPIKESISKKEKNYK